MRVPKSNRKATGQNGESLSPIGKIAAWSARHRWPVIGVSLAVLTLAVLVMSVMKVEMREDTGGSGEAQAAVDLIDERFGVEQESPEQLVFRNPSVTVDEASFKATVESVLDDLRGLKGVDSITSYYEAPDPSLVSADRHTLLVEVEVNSEIEDGAGALIDAVRANANNAPGYEIGIAGFRSLEHETAEITEEDFGMVLFASLGLGLIILLLAFRAVVAAVVPLALSVGAIIIAMGVSAAVSHVYPLVDLYAEMILLMGLAVGIDYSLFIVSRFRHERSLGRSKLEAIAVASNTTGRAVFYAGVTVTISVAGLLLTNNSIFASLALGAIIVVLVAVVGSLTLLPALLSVLGDNVNRLRVPFLAREGDGQGGIWSAITDRVLERPGIFAGVTAMALIALAVPLLNLNLGLNTGADSYPNAVEGKRVLEILEEEFSAGLTQPAVVVVDSPDVNSPEIRAAVDSLMRRAQSDSAFIGPFETIASPGSDLLMLRLPINADPSSKQAEDIVRFLHDDLVPEAFGATPAKVYVTGQTAGSMDFTQYMYDRAPYVFGFVLGLAFVLLLVMFRSIVIPIKAIALNLLSVGAAYGVLVLVFQEGIGQNLLGFEATGRIESWLPLFLFAILFGLSMDYHMLLLSRIKEAYDDGHSNEESVSMGIRATAGQITSAAAIMVGVFGAFALGRVLGFKQFGVGLGVAVLMDATVIRTVLLPATMKLLGDANWYMPKWLEWLPDLSVSERAEQSPIIPQPARRLEPQTVLVRIDE